MTRKMILTTVVFSVLILTSLCRAEIVTVFDHNNTDSVSPDFKFKHVPQPSANDAATSATFTLVDGRRDRNGGDLDTLHDGKLPVKEDQPAENFFFSAGTEGGRLLIDLGTVIDMKQINSYSWHVRSRGPQVYKLYAGTGKADGFEKQPANGVDPVTCGWTRIASVDTRLQNNTAGGQYGVSISEPDGTLGNYQYLLFDMSRTDASDPFSNTFFSEIDVVDTKTKPVAAAPAEEAVGDVREEIVQAAGGKYQITIDTTEAADLTEWAHSELAPVVQEWYPKLVEMLPSEGYEAPTRVRIIFSDNIGGVAATGGTRIGCNANWFRSELQGQAKGAIVHELVHVVQSYGIARRTNPAATRTPGWIVEGIPDYIRWFLYEPQTRGAEISRRSISRVNYDDSYRVSGNFLNWVTETYGRDIVQKLNAAARQGRYSDQFWTENTEHSIQELGEEWKAGLEKKIAAETAAAASLNRLTEEEKEAGWKLLFNGTNLDGWHNFKSDAVRPGWQVRDGALVCADPHNAGDLCTTDQYEWFELQLDYTISQAGNSGIMYHVTDEGGATWATGPEFQLEDNEKASDPIRCGWLYALYQPPVDPETDKILDATRPVGQWNHVRLLIAPEKCEHAINGVTYFDYVLGSDDFKERVAKSKFGRMPLFAKPGIGYIALQGDHGQVSFRNIKIRPIAEKK
jgi:hypothetical protein